MAVNRSYKDTFSADRTMTFTGNASEGVTITLALDVTTPITLTFPSSIQEGGSPTAVTTLAFAEGQHTISWKRKGSVWTFLDTTTTATNPAGASTNVQYNNGGSFGAEAAFTYDPATNFLGVDSIQLGTAGITITQDGDGALTLKGAGNGSDEDFRFNFDDTANTLTIDSTTGANLWNFSGIDVQVPTEVYDATGWNGDNTVPTKDAVRDKIEAVIAGTGGTGILGFTSSDTAVATGKVKGFVVCPYAGTISGWSIVVDAGTATVKVWKIASGTAKPTISNVINTSGVAISSGTAVISSTTSDFTTTTVTANDIFAFDITAASGVSEITFQLKITKS